MILRELVARLGYQVDTSSIRRFNNAVADSRGRMQKLTAEMGNFGRGVRNVGLGLTAALTLPIGILGRSMVRSASEAEESAQKFNVVFRDLEGQANTVARVFARDFGVAKDEAKELIGTTGDLLTGFGFTQDKALTLSEKVAQLGADLASFNNVQGGAQEAISRLTKGILGETENLKLLGIVVRQDTKDFKNRVAQIQASTGATLLQAKAEAIFQDAVRQSKNAIGDFARTSAGYANQVRILRARLRDLSISFGVILLPTVNRFVGVLLKVTEKINSLSPRAKKFILIFAGFAAVIGPVLLVIGLLITAVASVITSVGTLTGLLAGAGIGFGAIALVMIKVIAILALVGGAIYLLIDDMRVWMSAGDSVIGGLIGSFETFKNRIMVVFNAVKAIFSTFFKAIRTNGEKDWQAFLDAMLDGLKVFVKAGFKIFLGFFIVLGKVFAGTVEVIFGLIKAVFSRITGFIKATGVGKLLSKVFGASSQGAQTPGRGFTPFLPSQAPILTPSELNAGGAGGSNQINNIRQNVTLQVPDGTPIEQQKALETQTKRIFEENMRNLLNETVLASPKGEK